MASDPSLRIGRIKLFKDGVVMGDWDSKQKAAFVKAMGKNRAKFSKGGLIRRLGNLHYYDDGGTVLSGPSNVGGSSAQTVNNNGVVGGLGSLLGLNNQFQAQGATIQQGTNAGQLNQAYQGAQSGLGQQQQFADSLSGQGMQGMNTQNQLTGQLQGIVNGTGPNAAQMALNQNTGQNVQNQAALMASQRGVSANPGQIARLAAQQGAATQQESVGQAATLQAQQQIAAQQQLQSLASTQVGQQGQAIQGVNNAQQNEQNILQGANTSANNAAVTMQGNINNVDAQVAAANQQQAGNVFGGLASGVASIPSLFARGGEVPHMALGGTPLNVSPVGSTGVVGPWLNSSPASGGGASVASSTPMAGPTIAPIHSLITPKKKGDASDDDVVTDQDVADEDAMAKDARGGQVRHYDNGGWLSSTPDTQSPASISAPSSPPSSSKSGGSGGIGSELAQLAPLVALAAYRGGNICPGPHKSHVANYLHGGQAEKVKSMVSPGEVYLSPDKVRAVIHEGKNPLKIGEKIKGKASVKGDSLKNDTVPKTLEEGGVVIPRHIMNKMSPEKAELFVHRAMARRKARG